MNILHHESVQLYASAEELAQNWTRPGNSGSYAELTAGGRDGAPSIRPKRYGQGIVFQEIDERQVVGIHVSIRMSDLTTTAYGNPLLVAGSSARLTEYMDGSYTSNAEYHYKPSDLLSISMDRDGSLLVEHVVQRSTGSSSSLSRLVLGDSGFALTPGQLYSLEALIDVSGEMARIAVWLDGVVIVDAEFPRDRVTPYGDIRTDIIQYIGLGGYFGAGPDFSDICVYDAAEMPAPIGPLSVRHYPLDDPAFGLPIDDSTSVEIPKDGIDLSMPAGFPGSGPLLGAYFSARTMSAEVEEIYSTMYTLTGAPFGDLILTDDGLPGGNKSTRRHELEGVVDFGDLNGLTINARST